MLSRPTCDHDIVVAWAQHHQAVPAEVATNGPYAIGPTLSFLFSRVSQHPSHLRPISWEAFFAVFDLFDLAFAFEKDPGASSRFCWRHSMHDTEPIRLNDPEASLLSPSRPQGQLLGHLIEWLKSMHNGQ